MSARNELNSYIQELEGRLRLRAILRGAAILAGAALLTTIFLVVVVNHFFAFSHPSLTGARFVLFVAIICAAALGLALPLSRLGRQRAVSEAEMAFPQFQQRLVTFSEREAQRRDGFIELLAADTLHTAREATPGQLVTNNLLFAFAGMGVAALAVLIWVIAAGPGYLGYGASLLWTGQRAGAAPFYDIRVNPGDTTVRRNADQLVTAVPVGVQTDKVKLYARYHSASKWEPVAMQAQPGTANFQFLFAGLPEGVEYYVEAGALRSRHYNINVADMPGVKQIHVTYRYPSWTGMRPAVEEHGGDLRAIEGTQADLDITMDRPLRDGLLLLDNNQQIHLTGGQQNVYHGTIDMQKDGVYHVAGMDQGQPVRLSEDFFIAADKARPPDVAIVRPGRDYRASPIEEVTVAAKADDEFGINNLDLHYSVNGGPEQTVSVLKQKGAKQADGSTVLYLENYKLVPGDVVSVYATAKDARAESRTDIFFIQADPFEREFSQSQQSAGGGAGGGGGQNDQEISQREKELIASTWKQRNDKTTTKDSAAQASKFLSGVQSTLADQARSLSYRMQSRELAGQNDEFTNFVKDMDAAAAAMAPATDKLKQQKWNDALPDEQKALQNLLRAEAIFRQIQVAFGANGGGSGGGAGRDLASLFDLELDTEKNQYETGETANSAQKQQQDIDDALKKLDELARREEELAQQKNNGQSFEQRWQQEMLRRDAEELQKQLQQLAQNQAGASGAQGAAGSNQSSSGQSSSSQSGKNQPNGADSRAQQALDRLKAATDDMQRASGQQGGDDARRAADRLRQAQNLLGSEQQQQAAGQLNGMSQEANRLASQEKSQQDRLRKLLGGQDQDGSGADGQKAQIGDKLDQLSQLVNDRQRLADDLARLQRQMRDAERQLAPEQHATSAKLRDALGDLDSNDIETRVQRSADWMRRGINPSSNGTEADIAAGLQHLSDQMQQAQQALGPGGQQRDAETALDHLEEFRNRLEALNPGNKGGKGSGNQAGRQNGQPGQNAQNGSAAGNQAGGGAAIGDRGGYNSDGNGARYGANYGGGDRNGGIVYGNFDTGGNSNLPQPAARDNAILPADPQQVIQQGLNQLNEMRASVQDDPEALRQLQDLMREMQRLDPKRFPGNPALVEQLHAQVLSAVDKLELQLQRDQNDKPEGQVRGNNTAPVPSGYQDAVAEYFRKLSKNP